MDNIITAVITGIVSVIGVVIANSKTMAVIQEQIKHLQEEITEMKADIKEHNNYGKKFLEMQGDIKVLAQEQRATDARLKRLENENTN